MVLTILIHDDDQTPTFYEHAVQDIAHNLFKIQTIFRFHSLF